MTCNKTETLLYAYTKKFLPPVSQKEILAHLALCPSCTSKYKALIRLNGLFASSLQAPSKKVLHNIRIASGDKPFSLFRPAYALSFSVALFFCIFGATVLFKTVKNNEIKEFLNDTYSAFSYSDTEEYSYITEYHLEDIGLSDKI
ncbi:MAG: zf-HC2 domain-containing protein [bacterium]